MDMSIPYDVLEQATDGFSQEQMIGSGGYGKVYKGIYYGEEVAVKVFHDMLDYMPFDREFLNILRIQHPNVVRLFGYCYEKQHKIVEYNGDLVISQHIYKIVCYELLRGRSLEKYLNESSDHDWTTCYNIIKDTCQGLSFLHEGYVLHLDLKPANILLDNNMRAKVADFGMSRFFSKTHTHITNTTTGTEVYMAPEFRFKNQISPKNDVYSLGVVIIEILAGQRGCIDFFEMDDVTSLIELVITNWREWINATKSSCPSAELDQVETCIKIAIKCVDYERRNRPTVSEILDILQETEKGFHLANKVKGGSRISMGTTNKIMDASRDRVDIQFASSVLEHVLDGSMKPTNVPLVLLQHITGHFADERVIGQGGFAVVYKGYLQNGSSVAIKRLLNAHTIDEQLFYDEVIFLTSVKHKNIVRLLGYCASIEGKIMPNPKAEETMKFISAHIIEKLICFEHIKNGSLDKHLTDELSGLEWKTRYEIIKGICNGLDYLHNEKGVIHRDLKPANHFSQICIVLVI